ncbi:hypothetical protein [Arthrobacter yangruifuii]|uniref:hypothetical protein n=1 Tax=Arthrobacter yangruifuii TaxID=2606616 RepID=UPI0011B35CB0|nr:hypothetical protein [Arthrobacter yangruifuii]
MNRNRFSSHPAATAAPATAPSATADDTGTQARRRRRYLAGLAVVALGAPVLAGCSAGAALTPVADSSADPFEAYLAEELDQAFFAQDVLSVQCYADNGYPEYAQFIPTEPGTEHRSEILDQLTVADVFFDSVQDATERGLRSEPMPPAPAKIYVHDASFDAVATACNTKAWAALGAGAEDTLVEYNRLASKLSGIFDPTMDALAPLQEKVIQCLVDAGEPVTPAPGQLFGITPGVELGTPVEYPERSGPKKTSGMEIIPADTEVAYVPTPAEAALAVKYYNCSLETGARDEFAASIREAKKAAIAEHAAELEKLNPRMTEIAATARELTGR